MSWSLKNILLEVLPQTVEQKVFTGVRVANRLRTKKKERKNDDLSNFEILKDAKYFTICFPYRYTAILAKAFSNVCSLLIIKHVYSK